MRPLRWKKQYQTGDAAADQRNKGFVECLNGLINAADQREHCQEMGELIERFSHEAEEVLESHPTDRDLSAEFSRQLLGQLPLGTYGSPACRQCGLCDLARQNIADHLQASAACLHLKS